MLDEQVIECKCGVFGYRDHRHGDKFCSVCGTLVEMRDAKPLGIRLVMEEGTEDRIISLAKLNTILGEING